MFLNNLFNRNKKVIMDYPEDTVVTDKNPDCLVCPNCGSNQWYEGPSGGMAVNVKCAGCGLWFNNTPFGLDFIGAKDWEEDKPIVWYCPKCKTKYDSHYFKDYGKYPECQTCTTPLKICWSYKAFSKELCDDLMCRFHWQL